MAELSSRYTRLFTLVLCLLTAACSSTSSIHSVYDRNTDFDQYKRFSWTSKLSNADRNPAIEATAIDQIQSSIANELRGKNYIWTAEPISADFLVAFTIDIDDRIEVYREPPISKEDSTRIEWGAEAINPDNIANRSIEGSLNIYIYDVLTQVQVWSGTGNRHLDPQELATVNTESIDSSVTAILEKFPPD